MTKPTTRAFRGTYVPTMPKANLVPSSVAGTWPRGSKPSASRAVPPSQETSSTAARPTMKLARSTSVQAPPRPVGKFPPQAGMNALQRQPAQTSAANGSSSMIQPPTPSAHLPVEPGRDVAGEPGPLDPRGRSHGQQDAQRQHQRTSSPAASGPRSASGVAAATATVGPATSAVGTVKNCRRS